MFLVVSYTQDICIIILWILTKFDRVITNKFFFHQLASTLLLYIRRELVY
uniref:Uncharacterized protein n=1 Tax=Lepeophtheirus salmonis TaxID=72036 RepID=A0A0K2VJ74_LEPSM